jgi:hypothetical protein
MKKTLILAAVVLLAAPRARADEAPEDLGPYIVVGGLIGSAIGIGGTALQVRPVIASLGGAEPTRSELGWSVASSGLFIVALEGLYNPGRSDWNPGKAALLAAPYALLIAWDVWKLAHPVAVAPVVSRDTQGVALAMRF